MEPLDKKARLWRKKVHPGHLDPSSQLMTYKTPGGTAPGSNVFGDYIDLNELLNLDGGTEEDNSIQI